MAKEKNSCPAKGKDKIVVQQYELLFLPPPWSLTWLGLASELSVEMARMCFPKKQAEKERKNERCGSHKIQWVINFDLKRPVAFHMTSTTIAVSKTHMLGIVAKRSQHLTLCK